MDAYEQIALEADLPGGENFGKNPDEIGCGLPSSSLVAGEDQLSGRYAPWHAEREWRAEAAAAAIPVFMVHGAVPDTVPLQVVPRKAGDAQASIRASATPAAPGAGTRIAGVTSEYIPFTVEDGKDNSALVVGAVPSMPADVDLYLERLQPDGGWVAITSGASGELTQEGFTLGQPPPGTYRLEVHNWAGAPATRVDVTMTFLNSAGLPGPGS